MISGSPPTGIVMERHHGGEVARGDGRPTRPHPKIARQLGPEGSLERQILTGNGHPRIGKHCAREGHMVIQDLESVRSRLSDFTDVRQHLQTEMMLAHGELVAGECIESALELRSL